jgi:HipA-like protein
VAARTALDVSASGRVAGVLHRSDLEADSFLFTYAGGCRAEDAVSLTMPIIRDPYDAMGTVHPIFEMNLPEGALLEKLRTRFAKTVPDFDSLALLAIVGRSQIGRLRYALAGETPEEVPAEDLAQILAYRGAHDLFADLLCRESRIGARRTSLNLSTHASIRSWRRMSISVCVRHSCRDCLRPRRDWRRIDACSWSSDSIVATRALTLDARIFVC